MNTWITARCPHCEHDQQQRAHKYRLFRCRNRTDRDFYTFTCLACRQPAIKRANAEIVCLLLSGGVPVCHYHMPAEMSDGQRKSSVPLGRDELLDFLIDLAGWDGEIPDERTDRSGSGAAVSGSGGVGSRPDSEG